MAEVEPAYSILFVPVHEQRFVKSAPERGADVVLLDLEDSVPEDLKDCARSALAEAVKDMACRSTRIWVRVNSEFEVCANDIAAACIDGVEAILLPKVRGADHLQLVADHVGRCEAKAGLKAQSVCLIALIETAQALVRVHEIARASPRLGVLAFGGEDFCASCGISPTPEALTNYCQSLVLAAKAAGLPAIGIPGSIADVRDLAAFGHTAELAKLIGFDGVMCIHPRQVELVNRIYAPSEQALEEARRVVEAYERSVLEGKGAIVLDGKMIDLPVVQRARITIRRNRDRISAS